MENAREQMDLLLRELSDGIGEEIALDGKNGCTFSFRGMVMNMILLPDSGYVVLWTVLGHLDRDGNAPARVHWMLEQHDGGVGTKGFTFMLDRENDALQLGDRRSLLELETADHLASWIETLFEVARKSIVAFEQEFPFVDDEMFDVDEEDEEYDEDVEGAETDAGAGTEEVR